MYNAHFLPKSLRKKCALCVDMRATHHGCSNGSDKPVYNAHRHGCASRMAKHGGCGISLLLCKKKKDCLICGTGITRLSSGKKIKSLSLCASMVSAGSETSTPNETKTGAPGDAEEEISRSLVVGATSPSAATPGFLPGKVIN